MKTRKLHLKIITLSLFACLIWFSGTYATAFAGTTYYVDTSNPKAGDTNSGTEASPWKTIAKASTTMAAGDTTIVLPGTYNERVMSTRSGSSASPITFMASGAAKILGADVKHDYITINGFNLIDGYIDITNGNYCQILNNTLSPGYITMHFLNSNDSPTGCLIKGNRLNSIKSPDGDYVVIQLFGSNHIVENNEIGPASDIDAFRFWGHHHIIRNNYVHDLTYSPNSIAHMDLFQSFSLNGWSVNNVTIENNRFINSEGQLCMTSTDGSPLTHDIILRNNVFAHLRQNANIGIRNMSFLNNTFYDVGVFSGYKNDWGTSSNTTFKNNIFMGMQGYNPAFYDANLFINPEPWIFENNFFSTLSGTALQNFDTKVQIKAINGGIINFTNASANDFSIKAGSVVIDKGQTLSGFNNDLTGATRLQGAAWDIGAFEYAPGGGSATTLLPPTNLKAQ